MNKKYKKEKSISREMLCIWLHITIIQQIEVLVKQQLPKTKVLSKYIVQEMISEISF